MSRGGAILEPTPARPKPKSLIEAISDIQMYAAMERINHPVSADYLLFRERLGFFEVGLKGGLISTLVSGLTVPLSIAVIQELFPIFGTHEPTVFDQGFALALSMSFQLGYNVLIASNLSLCYLGAWCRTAVHALYGGLMVGKGLVVGMLFLFYHWLYFLMTPEYLGRLRIQFGFVVKMLLIKEAGLQSMIDWIQLTRPVLLTSAWVLVVFTILTLVITLAIFWRGIGTVQREQARLSRYDS